MPTRPPDLRRNTLINLGGSLVPVLVSLVTVPLYLELIGEARYGVLALSWLFLGYMGVASLGLGRACAHALASRPHESPRERARILWTGAGTAAVFGIAGGIVALVAGQFVLLDLVSMPAELRAELDRAFAWIAVAVPFVCVGLVCVGALEGLERFGLVNVLEVGAVLGFQVGPLIVAAVHGPELGALIAAATVVPVVATLVGLVVCTRTVAPGRPSFAPRLVVPLLRYGGWVSVSSVVSPLLTVLDRFVIGALVGARAVTYYTIPYNVVTRLIVIPISLSRSLFPRLASLGDDAAGAVAREATAALTAVMTPLVILAVVALEPFLRIWLGASFADAAAPAGAILLVCVWINALNFVPYVYLQARGRPDLPAKFHLAEIVPYVVGLLVAVEAGGIEGAAAAWTIRVAVDGALLFAAARTALRGVPARVGIGGALVVAGWSITTLALDALVLWAVAAVLLVAASVWGWRTAPGPLRRLGLPNDGAVDEATAP